MRKEEPARQIVHPRMRSYDERYERAMDAALDGGDMCLVAFLQKLNDATDGFADDIVDRALALVGVTCCPAV